VPSLAFLPLGGELRGVVLGAAVATTVGAIDDFRHLSWWPKLGGQVLAAAIPTWFGIYVHAFTFPVIGVHEVPPWVGIPITVIGIVAVMNMVNFLDGLRRPCRGRVRDLGLTFAVIDLLGSSGRSETPRSSARVPRFPPQLLSARGSSWGLRAACSASRWQRSPVRGS
jgi:UDP-N-acetylmuramyl pentapeptide phosphotransferase/UDP-N-acetylglucosamine-1-phosphate transferase